MLAPYQHPGQLSCSWVTSNHSRKGLSSVMVKPEKQYHGIIAGSQM